MKKSLTDILLHGHELGALVEAGYSRRQCSDFLLSAYGIKATVDQVRFGLSANDFPVSTRQVGGFMRKVQPARFFGSVKKHLSEIRQLRERGYSIADVAHYLDTQGVRIQKNTLLKIISKEAAKCQTVTK